MSSVFLGVNFGSADIKIGVVNIEGEVFQAKKYPTQVTSQQESLKALETTIADYLSIWNGETPSSIGIGLTGALDIDNGIWIDSINAHILTPVPLVEKLTKQFRLPVYIDNDVHAATLAENYYGIGRITKNFILINVDIGIAVGIVCNGNLIRGSRNAAGEMGHMCVEYNGDPCNCGSRGCLERIVSEANLFRQVVESLPLHPDSILNEAYSKNNLNSNTIFTAAQNGDVLASRVASRAIRALGIGTVNLVNLLNPEHIIFTGSVISNEWFFEQTRKYVFDNAHISTLNALFGYSMTSLSANNLEICGASCLCWLKD